MENSYLGNRGYSIIKTLKNSSQITSLKKELTVKPFVNKQFQQEAKPFSVFLESKRKIPSLLYSPTKPYFPLKSSPTALSIPGSFATCKIFFIFIGISARKTANFEIGPSLTVPTNSCLTKTPKKIVNTSVRLDSESITVN